MEVAEVVVELSERKSVSVDEAEEMKPWPKTKVVEVESSLVESLVKGKAKDIAVKYDPAAW